VKQDSTVLEITIDMVVQLVLSHLTRWLQNVTFVKVEDHPIVEHFVYWKILQDAKERGSDGYLHLDKTAPYWYQAVHFSNKVTLVQYTIANTAGFKEGVSVEVYVSTKTGKPTKENHEYSAIGFNVTFAIPRPDNYNAVIVYMNVVPVDQDKKVVQPKLFDWFSREYEIEHHFITIKDTKDELALWDINEYIFTLDVPEQSRVNFTLTLDVTKPNPEFPLSYNLYYSDLKYIDYPNSYNANIRVVRNQLHL
jgi:hypothetical protein